MQTLSLGFARPVTRTYTLRIKSGRVGRGHINGWREDWGDWEWDGDRLREFDQVLDEAYKAGVRLIIPIINQDYGGEDTNWVGNTTDLIRMRKGLSSLADAKKVDWWTDHQMIESFKLIIDKLVNRVNSINGRRYGEDPSILAWETGQFSVQTRAHTAGNADADLLFCWNGYGSAPAAWTMVVAKHIKSRARQLVMDGSYARTDNYESCFPKAILECPDVDLISYHYYGGGDTKRLAKDCQTAQSAGKVLVPPLSDFDLVQLVRHELEYRFVAGEFGLYQQSSEYDNFLQTLDAAGGGGALCWSLRPHSSKGGFKTHGEGNGQWSFHAPGWAEPLHGEFDPREASVIASIRRISYKVNGEVLPPLPTPSPPAKIWFTSPTQICWTGSPWASTYQVIVKNKQSGEERQKQVVDCTKEGCLAVDIGNEMSGWDRKHISIRMRAGADTGEFGKDSHEIGC
ncbi:mannan endo-1,4-beta-mannosidase, partial [Phenoliferia sp. Uapishka_3]